MRYFYICIGFITLMIGLLGIVTPGVPTTPFLLLTGFLFAKGSPRLHNWLHENRVTGYYLNRMKNGLSLKARLISIALMWCMVCFTSFVIFDYGTKRFVMLGLGVIGTIAQLIVLGRKKRPVEVFAEVENGEEGTPTLVRNILEEKCK